MMPAPPMPLASGTRLGPYEIASPLGAEGAPAARLKRASARAEAARAGVGSPHALRNDDPPAHAGDRRWR